MNAITGTALDYMANNVHQWLVVTVDNEMPPIQVMMKLTYVKQYYQCLLIQLLVFHSTVLTEHEACV